MKHLTALAAVLALAVLPVAAQQLEINDAGGSLTNAGTNPTVGTPFLVNLTGTISPRVSGSVPNSGFIFAGGTLVNPSTQFPLLNNQWWDLDLGSTQIIGDGISFSTPLAFLFLLNSANVCNFTFSSNSTLNGLQYAFQAITQDPAQAPFGLNLTAAFNYSWSNALIFSGDDTTQIFTTSQGPLTMYGVAYNDIAVCTNGWVKFGSTVATSDLSETVPEFLNGTINITTGVGTPMIAVDWEDLDMANTAAARVTVQELGPGLVEFRWLQGEYFATSPIWGDITLLVDNNGGFPIITMNYTAYAPVTAPNEGLVGITDGQLGGVGIGPDIGADIVTAGVVNPYGPTGINYLSYFQNFDGTGGFGNPPASPIDVGGTTITWIDASGFGDWAIF